MRSSTPWKSARGTATSANWNTSLRAWRSIKYGEVYLKAYQNWPEARRGIGAYLALYNQERPHQALGYMTPGQVFQEKNEDRGLLPHPGALSSVPRVRDFPPADSLISTSMLS